MMSYSLLTSDIQHVRKFKKGNEVYISPQVIQDVALKM